MPWYVIYTKSRSEKRVAEELRLRGVDVYCPMQRVRRKWSDRYKWVEEPLFRSYCFVRLEEHERRKVYGVPGFVRYLLWLNQPATVRESEIDVIKKMLNDYDHERIQVMQFDISDRVRIHSGLFMEQDGVVMARQGQKLMLWLDTLKAYITVDTRRTLVEKAQPAFS